ncbi:MAG: hypothetical protein K8F91_19495 [Candidatus Obscuribacterales bacterium]|nr:hypothetical protein [Candidatus Obscuribacterales bacterium]
MDQLLLSLRKRIVVPLVILVALAAWLILCHAHYKSYWFGTIYRVQTTDFNLLHHALPPTLSRMILESRGDLVQRTLDSTYGLFGLVVTDPSCSTVLWKTNKVYHRESWHHKATPDFLRELDEPFDVLTAPAALEPSYEHISPRSLKATRVGDRGGAILGRLYYLRADPPAFSSDLLGFFSTGLWEMSGAKRGYLYITLSTIAFSLVVLLVVWIRRREIELKQKELLHIQRELDIRKKALEHLSAELAAQKSRKIYLEKEADYAYKRALGLKKSLERLRDALLGGSNQQPQLQPGAQNYPLVRPPVHPPSAILEEIEALLPGIAENATVLKQQADVMHEYCSNLEQRQSEMQKIVDHAYNRAAGAPHKAQPGPSEFVDMSPG